MGQQLLQQPQPRADDAVGRNTNLTTAAGRALPSRRAPPPPQDKVQWRKQSRGNDISASMAAHNGARHVPSSPCKKPVRPAPVPPAQRRRHYSTSSLGARVIKKMPLQRNSFGNDLPTFTSASLNSSYPPPPDTEVGHTFQGRHARRSDPKGFSASDSMQYETTHLNISLIDRDLSPSAVEGVLSPFHTHSPLDPLAQMQPMSSSLPQLLDEAGDSPNQETPLAALKVEDMSSTSPSQAYSHTRHLSLMGGAKKEGGGRHTSRNKTLRSRSPPNLPPPPPPPPDPMESLLETSQSQESQFSLHSSTPVSSASTGFSEVLHTISDINQQLEGITENFTTSSSISAVSHPPSRPPPLPPTHTEPTASGQVNSGPAPFPARLTTDLAQGPLPKLEVVKDGFHEEDWMCDASTDLPDSSILSHDFIPPSQVIPTLPTHAALSSDLTNGKAEHKSGKGHVMFREHDETIPKREPGEDHMDFGQTTSSREHEARMVVGGVPASVAAIKMKLFGGKEQEATRYKKEGVLSPKYVHPENITFSKDYFDSDHVESTYSDASPTRHYDLDGNSFSHHDNANNNNSEEESAVISETVPCVPKGDPGKSEDFSSVATPYPLSSNTVDDERACSQNQDMCGLPCNKRRVSKYKVIGIVRSTVTPPMEAEPSPVILQPSSTAKLQYAEVSVQETPKPFTTEVRNVHSLERSLLRKGGMRPQSPTSTALTTTDSTLDELFQPRASVGSAPVENSRSGSDSIFNVETSPLGNTTSNSSGRTPPSSASLDCCSDDKTPPSSAASPEAWHLKQTFHGDFEQVPSACSTAVVSDSAASSSSALTRGVSLPGQRSFSSDPSSVSSTPYTSRVAAATSRDKMVHKLPSGMATSLDGLPRREAKVIRGPRTKGHILRSLV